jgi:hypothetical protein
MKSFFLFLLSAFGFSAQCQDVSCDKKIFPLDDGTSMYGGFTYLDRICHDTASLIWYDTTDGQLYRDQFKMFKELIQYETHFSGILDNFIYRQYGRLAFSEEKQISRNNRYSALVLEVQYYYKYQCDTFINVVNRYQVTTTGHPREEGAPVLYDTWNQSVFIFFDNYSFGDENRDKLDIIRKRVMDLVKKY